MRRIRHHFRKLGRVGMGHIPLFRYAPQIPQKSEGPGRSRPLVVGSSIRRPYGVPAPSVELASMAALTSAGMASGAGASSGSAMISAACSGVRS